MKFTDAEVEKIHREYEAAWSAHLAKRQQEWMREARERIQETVEGLVWGMPKNGATPDYIRGIQDAAAAIEQSNRIPRGSK